MRRSHNVSTFNAGDCNTICDRTGFKVKLKDTVRTWDGYQVVPEANSIRNQQDFPPTILRTAVHKASRSEPFFDDSVITPPSPV